MDTEYPVELCLTLRPVGHPWVRVGVNGHYQTTQLETVTNLEYNFNATDQVCLTVEHFNKSNDDPSTAVEIIGISFYGISDPKFAWSGKYRPAYPEPWYSEQSPAPDCVLLGQTYLGWNGVYSLEFTVPVFTWMHQIQNLGWIYQ